MLSTEICGLINLTVSSITGAENGQERIIYIKKFQICLKRRRKFNNSPFPFKNWRAEIIQCIWCTLFLEWNFRVEVGFSYSFCQNPNILLKKGLEKKQGQRMTKKGKPVALSLMNHKQCTAVQNSSQIYYHLYIHSRMVYIISENIEALHFK